MYRRNMFVKIKNRIIFENLDFKKLFKVATFWAVRGKLFHDVKLACKEPGHSSQLGRHHRNNRHLKQQTFSVTTATRRPGRERLKVANTPSLSKARENATVVSRSHAWDLKINNFLLIPIDVAVIQLYVEFYHLSWKREICSWLVTAMGS